MDEVAFTPEDFENLEFIENFNEEHWKAEPAALGRNYDVPNTDPQIVKIKGSLRLIKSKLENKKADVVLSDMSPDISGNYSVDQARSIFLCEQALNTANSLLRSGGSFVCKVFSGEDLPEFIEKVKSNFKIVKQFSPPASRKTSSEIYIIAKFLQKNVSSRILI